MAKAIVEAELPVVYEGASILPALARHPRQEAMILADATRRWPLRTSVDCIVTSPPYWQKRDYGSNVQLGQEPTPTRYVANVGKMLRQSWRALTEYGNLFLNVGDSHRDGSWLGIPAMIEDAARDQGFRLTDRIIWAKAGGVPQPHLGRLANRHEYILHLTKGPQHFNDLHGYSNVWGNGANPGDVWGLRGVASANNHLAPFPLELAQRAIHLGCPLLVEVEDGRPATRIVKRTFELDENRPQARRAKALARKHKLTAAHLRAVQAVGINDAGKARKFQSGSGQNSREVQRLAKEAKRALGGYFREFTFAKRKTAKWDIPNHGAVLRRAIVLDPFAGTGTTLRAAASLQRSAIGFDVRSWNV